MKSTRQDNLKIIEEAAEWVSVMENPTAKEEALCHAWLRQSSEHVEEFLLVSAILQSVQSMDPERSIDIKELLKETAANVVSLQPYENPFPPPAETEPSAAVPEPPPAQSSFPRRYRWWGLAAAVASVAVLAGFLWMNLGWQHYETAVGEQSFFELEDGSTLHLNTQSKVKLRFSPDARNVQLLAGEALFTVAKDSARPFCVYAGDTVIQAVGTQFNVYRRKQGTTISVIEGAVRIAASGDVLPAKPESVIAAEGGKPGKSLDTVIVPAKLEAGEEARVASNGEITKVATADIGKANAWLQRRLIFRNDRLADVAAEFNRYNRVPQILVEGDIVAERRLTGVFDADAPEALLLFLADDEHLSIARASDEAVVIRSAGL